jgi:catechol 2,3-dioxygenase-like lactoylglutathione lyase family enzyme
MHLHHASLFVNDAERSLAFYRDGLGLEVVFDREFDGPWPTLFGVTSGRLRAVSLGDPERPQLGQLELVMLADPLPAAVASVPPVVGGLLLSFFVDLDVVLPALGAAGGTDVRRASLDNGIPVATVRDPDGVLIELLHVPPAATS